MTNKIESIAAKIRALLAKTVENGASEAEAMMAMQKASELMAKHNISITEVELREEGCTTNTIDTGRKARDAMRYATSAIAEFCDCKVWFSRPRGGTVSYKFFGQEQDTLIAEYIFDLIANTMKVESDRYKTTYEYYNAARLRGGRRRASNSFEIGFVERVALRLREMARQKKEQYRSSGTDLMVVKSQIVEAEYKKLGLKLRSCGTKSYVHSGAFNKGAEAGDRVNITTGVASSGKSQALLG